MLTSPSFLLRSEWGASGNPPADDGVAGMNPDGLIESNWDQVSKSPCELK